MATITFIGDGANHVWSSTGAWVGGVVPTAADDVVFSSNTAGSSLQMDGSSGSPNVCRSLDCTGYTRTILHQDGTYLAIGDAGGGSLTLVSGMTYVPGSDSHLRFVSTTTGNNITSAGKTLGKLDFNGAGGGWTLQDNLTFNSSSTITLTAGTLIDNGKTVSAFSGFSSSNSNTRALTISGSWSVGVWDITISTGLTLTATGSTITTGTFYGGGKTYGTVVLNQSHPILYDANTFANLTYTGAGIETDTITFMVNQTVTSTLSLNGDSAINRLLVKSDIKGTQRTLTTAANSISNADFQDIVGAGASGWNLSAITGGSGDCQGCSGITFTTPTNCYMKKAGSGGIAWSGSDWFTTSGGSTPARIPLPQDTAIFDANSFNSTGVNVVINMPRIGAMVWTGVTNTPNLDATVDFSLFGDLTFTTGMSQSSTGVGTFENRGSLNLDGGGGVWGLGIIYQNGPGGTVNITSDYTISRTFITSGTWSNGSYALTVNDVLTIQGGTFNLGSGGLTCDVALALSAGTLEMNGNTIVVPHGGVGASTVTISGGVLNLSGQLGGDSTAITVSGGTINDTGSAGELVAYSATFTGGTSVIRKLTLATGLYSQSSTSSVEITGSATYGGWNMEGTDFTFTTPGVPTWSAGTLTIVPPGGSGGGSWTFC